MRVHTNGHRRTVTQRVAGVDPVRGHDQVGRRVEIGRRIPERAAALISEDDEALDLRRPTEKLCSVPDATFAQQLADSRRRDVADERNGTDIEPELAE